ncbi:MAG: di/tricarboxylate transporter [Pseudohongiellaceae bacterium]|jgi:di/tricarboxylate transporter
MTIDAYIVLAVVLGSFFLFVSEIVAVDLIGLLVIAVLLITGVLEPHEALSGFSNEALITVAAMFVLSAGLIRSGVLDWLRSGMFALAGENRLLLVLVLMVTVAISSAFLNNTPVAVIFLPIVLGVATTLNMAPSKLLIPMSYASILGGTCTLVGTSTNLLVSQVAESHGGMAIGMFDFTVPGLIFAGAGFVFLATVGHRLLPDRASVSDTTSSGHIREFVTEICFQDGSPLVGKSYKETLAKLPGITPLMLIRGDVVIFAPLIADPRAQFIRASDVLLLKGDPGSINALLERDGVTLPPELGGLMDNNTAGKTVTMVELVVNPNSPLIGRTIGGSEFSRRHGGAAAVAVLRHDEHLRKRVSQIRLRLGDTLLVVCDEGHLDKLRNSTEFMLLEGLDKQLVRRDNFRPALTIMLLVVGLAAVGVAPISTLAVTGVVAMVLTGCMPLRLAYSAVDMSIILLIAGMLSLGQALEKTGLVGWASTLLLDGLQIYGPTAVMGGIYLSSMIITCMVSNNAVAVLMTPVALEAARAMGIAPEPLVFATLFGASASFATPIGYQTNLFVYAPGGYRFTDYMRIGIPLQLLLFAIALWLIPWWWPFEAAAI